MNEKLGDISKCCKICKRLYKNYDLIERLCVYNHSSITSDWDLNKDCCSKYKKKKKPFKVYRCPNTGIDEMIDNLAQEGFGEPKPRYEPVNPDEYIIRKPKPIEEIKIKEGHRHEYNPDILTSTLKINELVKRFNDHINKGNEQ